MRNLIPIVLVLLVWSQVNAFAQTEGTVGSSDRRKISDEEVILSAYEKLVRYHKATVLYEFKGKDEDVPATEFLKFELRNFHSGPLSELDDVPFEEFIPPPGAVIEVVIGSLSENGGPGVALYQAQWSKEETTRRPAGSLALKMADIFRIAPAEFFDVGKYTSYEVTVSFRKNTRTYKCFAFLHNLHESSAKPWFQFADFVIGNGAVGHVFANKLPAVKGKNPAVSGVLIGP